VAVTVLEAVEVIMVVEGAEEFKDHLTFPAAAAAHRM